MRSLTLSLALWIALVAQAAAVESRREVGDLGAVGTVQFPTSCDPAVQRDFNRGVALLHSFFYEEARRVFTDIAQRDPECAMAHWGIAMTYNHPIWTAPDSSELAAGRAAVEKALAATKQNERERSFIRAVEAFYKGLDAPEVDAAPAAASCHAPMGSADPKGRAACFRREMEKAAARYPDDIEANAFYALALLGTAPAGDPSLAQQKKAAQILEKWYAVEPNHPGLAHYLIHSYDYPPLAALGLPAARAYAHIAPWVPHALHMPSHIFTRLGMWDESVQSNLASAEASQRYAAVHHPDAASFEELHALDYLAYAYLQTAQDAKAKGVLDRLNSIQKTHPENDFVVGYAFGAIPARYALERRQWKEAAALEVRPMPFWDRLKFAEGLIDYARAIGAARSGDLVTATRAADRLAQLAAASPEPRYKYFADQMQIQRRAALGWIALARGEKDSALGILRRAAASEDSLGKHPVSPGAILPVRELLGEALLECGHPDEALVEFQAALQIYPRRFNGIRGAALAACRAGRNAEASGYYRDLLELAKAGNATRPELAEARTYLASR